MGEIVKINVGGTRFETHRANLMKLTYFKSLFEGKWKDTPLQQSGEPTEIFIDRNPKGFECVLDICRDVFKSGTLEMTRDDIDFYGLDVSSLEVSTNNAAGDGETDVFDENKYSDILFNSQVYDYLESYNKTSVYPMLYHLQEINCMANNNDLGRQLRQIHEQNHVYEHLYMTLSTTLSSSSGTGRFPYYEFFFDKDCGLCGFYLTLELQPLQDDVGPSAWKPNILYKMIKEIRVFNNRYGGNYRQLFYYSGSVLEILTDGINAFDIASAADRIELSKRVLYLTIPIWLIPPQSDGGVSDVDFIKVDRIKITVELFTDEKFLIDYDPAVGNRYVELNKTNVKLTPIVYNFQQQPYANNGERTFSRKASDAPNNIICQYFTNRFASKIDAEGLIQIPLDELSREPPCKRLFIKITDQNHEPTNDLLTISLLYRSTILFTFPLIHVKLPPKGWYFISFNPKNQFYTSSSNKVNAKLSLKHLVLFARSVNAKLVLKFKTPAAGAHLDRNIDVHFVKVNILTSSLELVYG